MFFSYFAGHGTIMLGNIFYHLAVFFPGCRQPSRIMHGNRTETQHLFPQIMKNIDQTLISAGMVQNIMKPDIRINDFVKFIIGHIFVNFHQNAFQTF